MNRPVVDDGYRDQAVALLGDHQPSGPLRGGKYSAFDAGTRVPFLAHWPDRIRPGKSDALMSQIDLFASLVALTGRSIPTEAGPDSREMLATLLGESTRSREYVIEHSSAGVLSIIKDGWKYIEPHEGARVSRYTNIELGNDPEPQLYNLIDDLGEQHNLATRYPEKVDELAELLESVRN